MNKEFKTSETTWRNYEIPLKELKIKHKAKGQPPEIKCDGTKIIKTVKHINEMDLSFISENETIEDIYYDDEDEEIVISTVEEK